MDIIISCDGAYTRRSYASTYNSRFCLAFASEAHTGTVVDVIVVEHQFTKIKGIGMILTIIEG